MCKPCAVPGTGRMPHMASKGGAINLCVRACVSINTFSKPSVSLSLLNHTLYSSLPILGISPAGHEVP